MKYKTITYGIYLLCGLILSLMVGCDSVLDLEAQGTLNSQSFYQDEDDALAALTAAYSPLQDIGTYQNNEWMIGDVVSDDATAPTGASGSYPYLIDAMTFTTTADNQAASERWNSNYQGIYRANVVLQRVPETSMDEGLKQRILAEAKFLRALYYFNLVKVFGGVPLITEPLDQGELQTPRAEAGAVYDQIVQDLQEASTNLPLEYSDSEQGRATQGAAKALLGKVYLYRENWEAAVGELQAVVDSGVYSLMDNYEDVFELQYENGIESIFSVQFVATPGDGTEQLALWLPEETNLLGSPAYGTMIPTQDLADAYEEGDPRKEATLLAEGDTPFGVEYNPEWSETGYNARKYLTPQENLVSSTRDSPLNYMIIRYADVLLMLSEALNEQGRVSEAETYLNEVRSRVDMPPVTGLTQSSMREAIRHERRVELALEAERFFDLVRWGIASEELDGFVEGTHERFPIPQNELDVNTELTQNPGYN